MFAVIDESAGADDATLRAVGQLTALRLLSLRGCYVTDGGIAHLKGLLKLKRVDLHGCPVGDEAIAGLAEVKHF